MANLPEILLSVTDEDGASIAVVGNDIYPSLDALTSAHTALQGTDAATELAQAVTHFARGKTFSVIDDPDAYEAAYIAQLETEDPSVPWQQGITRLVDFGVPDFSAITVPTLADGSLIWAVRDAFSGLPYSAKASLPDLNAPQFSPMSLKPVPRGDIAQDAGQTRRRERPESRSVTAEDNTPEYDDSAFDEPDPVIPDLP